MLAYFEWLVRAVAGQWMLVATLYASFGVVRLLLPAAPVALRWTATGAVGVWWVTVGFHLLLTLRLFNLPAAFAFVTAAALAVHQGLRRRGGVLAPLRADASSVIAGVRSSSPGAKGALAGAAIVAIGFGARAMSVPVLSWDSLTYHAVKAGLWVQGASPIEWAAPGGWSIYRTYLGGGEALLAWAMLPFHADTLCGLVDVAVWLLLGLAVYALAEEADLPRSTGVCAALYVMALPAVARTVGSLYIDNTQAMLLVGTCALALFAVRERSTPAAALVLATLGSAAGVKIFAAPVAALLSLVLVVLFVSRDRSKATVLWLAGGGMAAGLAVGPWLVRTWQRTGYPLSPLPIRLGPLTLGESNAALRWYMDRPQLDGAGFAEELRALGRMLGLPGLVEPIEPTLGFFLIVPIVLAIPAAALLVRRRPWMVLLFALFVGPLVLSFYGTGMRNTRLIWAAVSGRYLIAAVAVIVVLAATPLRGRVRTAYSALLVLAAAWHLVANDLRGWVPADFLFAGVAVAVVVAAALATGRIADARRRGAAALLLVALLTAGLHGYRERYHRLAIERTTVLHALPRYWAPGSFAVDDPDGPRTVAVTAGPWQDADNWLVYPFLGRRLQNKLVWVSPIPGTEALDMERYADEVTRSDFDAWRTALSERDVTDVLSLAPPSIELTWMERHPAQFARIAGDGRRWGLYSVVEGTGADR